MCLLSLQWLRPETRCHSRLLPPLPAPAMLSQEQALPVPPPTWLRVRPLPLCLIQALTATPAPASPSVPRLRSLPCCQSNFPNAFWDNNISTVYRIMSNLHLTKVPLSCLGLLATATSHSSCPVPLLSQHPESKGTNFKTVCKQATLFRDAFPCS